jgi:hypothetical protein
MNIFVICLNPLLLAITLICNELPGFRLSDRWLKALLWTCPLHHTVFLLKGRTNQWNYMLRKENVTFWWVHPHLRSLEFRMPCWRSIWRRCILMATLNKWNVMLLWETFQERWHEETRRNEAVFIELLFICLSFSRSMERESCAKIFTWIPDSFVRSRLIGPLSLSTSHLTIELSILTCCGRRRRRRLQEEQ